MNIVLLGSGNVATHLGRAFKLGGQNILQVWSRDINNARELADTLAAEAISDMSDLNKSADLYLIAVKDEAIREVASALKVRDKLIVHTSGSTGLDALKDLSLEIGVFYPLQTFSKSKAVDFRQIPIVIEGNTAKVTALIRSIADRLSERIIELSSSQRKALHLAAVIACNFSNHLFALSKELLEKQNIDFNLLRPLIAETAEKIQLHDPESAQTGPAIRGDQDIIKGHLELLRESPELMELYERLSHSIINLHQRSDD